MSLGSATSCCMAAVQDRLRELRRRLADRGNTKEAACVRQLEARLAALGTRRPRLPLRPISP